MAASAADDAMDDHVSAGTPPQISILMAVYDPRMDWLEEQLRSLNAQTRRNLRLYVQDDCSPTVPHEEIRRAVERCVTAFPAEIGRNEQNLGSNGTFALLTERAEGDFFAYCDQDDVWLPEKLETLECALRDSGALLACSDMLIIDGEGRQVADSITKVRRHHRFRSGGGLAGYLLFHNFAAGCTMLVRADEAKAALPFCPYMVHDHYLAFRCAARGRIQSVTRPLIRYRIHGGNQTGLLAGITDRASYGRVRIDAPLKRIGWLWDNLSCDGETERLLADALAWLQARRRNWDRAGGAAEMLRHARFDRAQTLAELLLSRAPERIFARVLSLAQSNRI